MSDAPLEDALRAAQAGEAWAARVLYDHLAPRVLGYLRTRGASEPEDLTSEVFLTMFHKLGNVTGGVTGLRTFTFSVAHARLVDDLRRRSRREPESPYLPENDPRASPSAEQVGLERLQQQELRVALDTLVPDQRDVLVLRILGDLSLEQTAEALDKSEGAVKQLQRRGLIALRRHLSHPTEEPKGVTL